VFSVWDGALLLDASRVIFVQVAVAFLQHLGVHPDDGIVN